MGQGTGPHYCAFPRFHTDSHSYIVKAFHQALSYRYAGFKIISSISRQWPQFLSSAFYNSLYGHFAHIALAPSISSISESSGTEDTLTAHPNAVMVSSISIPPKLKHHSFWHSIGWNHWFTGAFSSAELPSLHGTRGQKVRQLPLYLFDLIHRCFNLVIVY